MNKVLTSKGVVFYSVIIDGNKNDQIWTMLDYFQVPSFFLSTPHKYETYGNHWTPKGHEEISSSIFQILKTENIIP